MSICIAIRNLCLLWYDLSWTKYIRDAVFVSQRNSIVAIVYYVIFIMFIADVTSMFYYYTFNWKKIYTQLALCFSVTVLDEFSQVGNNIHGNPYDTRKLIELFHQCINRDHFILDQTQPLSIPLNYSSINWLTRKKPTPFFLL